MAGLAHRDKVAQDVPLARTDAMCMPTFAESVRAFLPAAMVTAQAHRAFTAPVGPIVQLLSGFCGQRCCHVAGTLSCGMARQGPTAPQFKLTRAEYGASQASRPSGCPEMICDAEHGAHDGRP